MKVLIIAVFGILTTACAIDPSYDRALPGVKGIVMNNGAPVGNVEVVYAKGFTKTCKYVVARATTNRRGEFRFATKRSFKMIEVLPKDGCKFTGNICLDGKSPWKFTVNGKGEKTYHTGGHLTKEPGRLMSMKSEGYCKTPKWIHVACQTTEDNFTKCELDLTK